MNSSQVLAAVENGSDGHSNTNYNVSSGSYDPFAFGYNSTYGKIAVQLNGQSQDTGRWIARIILLQEI